MDRRQSFRLLTGGAAGAAAGIGSMGEALAQAADSVEIARLFRNEIAQHSVLISPGS